MASNIVDQWLAMLANTTSTTTTLSTATTTTSTTTTSTTTTTTTNLYWILRAQATHCSNRDAINIGAISIQNSPKECGEWCQSTNGCTGFGFQARPSSTCTGKQDFEGACYLWGATCNSISNPCWDDYLSPQPAVEFILRSSATFCLNSADIKLGDATIESSPANCARQCQAQISNGCGSFSYQRSTVCEGEKFSVGTCHLWNGTYGWGVCQDNYSSCFDEYWPYSEPPPTTTSTVNATATSNITSQETNSEENTEQEEDALKMMVLVVGVACVVLIGISLAAGWWLHRGGCDTLKREKKKCKRRWRAFVRRHEMLEYLFQVEPVAQPTLLSGKFTWEYLLLPPTGISKKDEQSIKEGVRALLDGKISLPKFHPEVFICFELGTRSTDAVGTGPGMFYAAAITKLLFQCGVPCFSDLLDDGSIKTVFLNRLRCKSSRCKLLLILETRDLYQSNKCLREIYACVRKKVALQPIRFDDPLPRFDSQWKNINWSDVSMVSMHAEVLQALSLPNVQNKPKSIPRTNGTIIQKPTELGAVLESIKPFINGTVQSQLLAKMPLGLLEAQLEYERGVNDSHVDIGHTDERDTFEQHVRPKRLKNKSNQSAGSATGNNNFEVVQRIDDPQAKLRMGARMSRDTVAVRRSALAPPKVKHLRKRSQETGLVQRSDISKSGSANQVVFTEIPSVLGANPQEPERPLLHSDVINSRRSNRGSRRQHETTSKVLQSAPLERVRVDL